MDSFAYISMLTIGAALAGYGLQERGPRDFFLGMLIWAIGTTGMVIKLIELMGG